MKYPWAFAGATVMCVNSQGWISAKVIGNIAIFAGERPGPEFMQQCEITEVSAKDDDLSSDGHDQPTLFSCRS